MDISIMGLPKSGKTTIFNALTKGHAVTSSYITGGFEPNIGVVKVSDPRLERLENLFHPRRTVPAEVRYVDVAGSPKGLGKSEGISGPYLNYLGQADAIIHVVRAFQNPEVPHPEGSVDPDRDIAAINMEMLFADMAILERRIERLDVGLKGARASERDAILKEQVWLREIKKRLEEEIPLREQKLEGDYVKTLENYPFLTLKPLLILLNLGEDELPQEATLEAEYQARHRRPLCEVLALCGKLEMELGELSEGEATEFRQALGMEAGNLDRVIQTSYQLLGLATFFTTGSDEVKAWTIKTGTPAPHAAGKIHSDMERGFIRAEVIGLDELLACRGYAEARRRGLVRLEGKTYLVKDEDVITFLFNV